MIGSNILSTRLIKYFPTPILSTKHKTYKNFDVGGFHKIRNNLRLIKYYPTLSTKHEMQSNPAKKFRTIKRFNYAKDFTKCFKDVQWDGTIFIKDSILEILWRTFVWVNINILKNKSGKFLILNDLTKNFFCPFIMNFCVEPYKL